MRIGFIGLGIMGKPMAKNLLKAGHQVVVSSHNQATAAELSAAGASTADSPKQIAEQVELVITMLPNSPDVKAVAKLIRPRTPAVLVHASLVVG